MVLFDRHPHLLPVKDSFESRVGYYIDVMGDNRRKKFFLPEAERRKPCHPLRFSQMVDNVGCLAADECMDVFGKQEKFKARNVQNKSLACLFENAGICAGFIHRMSHDITAYLIPFKYVNMASDKLSGLF